MARHRVPRREIRPPDARRWVGRSLVRRDNENGTATVRAAAAVKIGPARHARIPLGSYTVPITQLHKVGLTGRIPLADRKDNGSDVRAAILNTGCRLVVLPNVRGNPQQPATVQHTRKERENTRNWYDRCARLAERVGGRVLYEPGTHSPLRMGGGVVVYVSRASTAAAAVCADNTLHGWLAYAPPAGGVEAAASRRLVWLPMSAIRTAGPVEWAG